MSKEQITNDEVKQEITEQVNEEVTEQVNEEVTELNTPQPIGQLFNTINYHNVEDLNNFITNMTPDQSLYILVQAARASHSRGIFSIEESETVSRAIRTITSSSNTPQEPEDSGETN